MTGGRESKGNESGGFESKRLYSCVHDGSFRLQFCNYLLQVGLDAGSRVVNLAAANAEKPGNVSHFLSLEHDHVIGLPDDRFDPLSNFVICFFQ